MDLEADLLRQFESVFWWGFGLGVFSLALSVGFFVLGWVVDWRR